MSKQVKLAVQQRTETGRNAVKKIKEAGFVPAVVYSHQEETLNLKVNEREISNLLGHAAGENILVDLAIEGQGTSRLALIKEVQHHPVSQRILHVDFHGISANETIEASVPVEPVGEAVGVKTYGGLLEQLVRTITVRTLPKDLPEIIQVDVTDLNVGQPLHIKDIKLPEGVTPAGDGDITVFLIAEPKVSLDAQAQQSKK